VPALAPITPIGLPSNGCSGGRDAQSIAFFSTPDRVVVLRRHDQQSVGRLDTRPQILDRRGESLLPHVLVVQRDRCDIEDLDRHAGRRQFLRRAQRRRIERTAPQAAGHTEDTHGSPIAHGIAS
jgi:hypothetical protein